ncbi:uncharacterized protein BX664DRAFT_324827 [Halteromyces radiatus]|uniref:uncharacterized protein n=1 Tax=Halteromyces radiatus TaxID=101107 RepID=UPI00221ECF4A|nr:uncharacterized protein BX664DRAFT_324827 [Halteromyces radiatus]KAI8096786.1 hypothetical protein BX664DRAFT_324827 [Halteromyces radiatus]
MSLPVIDSEISQHHNKDNNNSLDQGISPPPSPPPIHSLYTEGHVYPSLSGSILSTRNNKTSSINQTKLDRNQFLLQPKQSMPTKKDDPSHQEPITRRQKFYGYMRQLMIYLLKQLMKKNNLALVINGIHQVWRARFFMVHTVRTTYHVLTSYPYHQAYREAWMIWAQIVNLVFFIAKKEQLSVHTLASFRNLEDDIKSLSWINIMMVARMYLSHLQGLLRLGIRTGVRALRHISAWESVVLAITSVALTRSLQNPSHWM